MPTILFILTPLFPWDRANESVLGHHHLIAAYCFAWGIQLAYLGYVGLKWRALARAGRQSSSK
jgi:hypothetical protein